MPLLPDSHTYHRMSEFNIIMRYPPVAYDILISHLPTLVYVRADVVHPPRPSSRERVESRYIRLNICEYDVY